MNVRELLTGIGMGNFNATMAIPYMMISPSTTDPKSAQIILMVQHIQRSLFQLGYHDVPDSGELDLATANALLSVVGPNWNVQPWSASITAIIAARKHGHRAPRAGIVNDGVPMAVGGPLDFLPDVPGGIFTYGIGAYLLYRHFTKKGR
ncbi:MAG TPA: hypothetical protein VK601_31235 [Kofleriaceae bacterium]|nr:hypothetical protein [Kofleriaceae bacterium]